MVSLKLKHIQLLLTISLFEFNLWINFVKALENSTAFNESSTASDQLTSSLNDSTIVEFLSSLTNSIGQYSTEPITNFEQNFTEQMNQNITPSFKGIYAKCNKLKQLLLL